VYGMIAGESCPAEVAGMYRGGGGEQLLCRWKPYADAAAA
jgi:hypothetical protein